jgi:hypothetical protein
MTSTRNKNTQLNYNLEKSNTEKIFRENIYSHSSYGRPISECIPSLGYMPSHISREALSHNSIDIESQLRGIGSTNLETHCERIIPNITNLEFKDFFDRPQTIIMPYPMVYEINQRPALS